MAKYIIILPSGEELSSGVDTVNAIASIKHTAATNSGTELTPGSVCAAMVEATLITPAGGLSLDAGADIELYEELDSGARVKIGVFTVEKPTRSSANRMKITAYDHVAKLDKDLTEWLREQNEYPYTMQTFVDMVCAACGVERIEQEIPNASFQIIAKPTEGNVTGRQILKWCAEIAGKFVTADADGKLQFGWYEESGIVIEPSGDNFYFSGTLKYEDYSVEPVTAVKVRLASNENGALWPPGETDNPYIVQDNKLLQLNTTAVSTSVLDVLHAAVARSYTPCKVSVPASIGVKVGQVITIRDLNGAEFQTLVMETQRTGQKVTVTSTGNKRRDSSENAYGDQYLKDYADAAVKDQTQQNIFDKLTNGGTDQGVYLKDGKIYLNAEFMQAGYLSSDIIRAGYIRSTDFELGNFPMYYPGENVYPSHDIYPSNGEQIVRGFEIDFEAGVIRGVFWSEITETLSRQVSDMDERLKAVEETISGNRPVYPVSV